MKQEQVEQIFRQHYGQMIRLARRLLYDDEESRDVVSEVFATLMRLDLLPRDVESYLLMSVRNRCLNILEHKDVRTRFEQAYTAELAGSDPSDKPMQDADEEEERLRRLLAFAERNLSEKTLRVFRMRHIEGMSYQAISDELGISRVMVYKHLAQAMKKIREYKHQFK